MWESVGRLSGSTFPLRPRGRSLLVLSSAVANGKLAHGYGSLLKLGDDVVAKREAEISLALAGAAGVTWDPSWGRERKVGPPVSQFPEPLDCRWYRRDPAEQRQ